jgi:hypothetical protein
MTWVITIEITADQGRKDLFNHGGTLKKNTGGAKQIRNPKSALRNAVVTTTATAI